MKITNIKTIVTCPDRNFVTVKIETDEGIYGIGDATLNGRELAVVSYIDDHVAPSLIGHDAGRIEDIWQYLYRGCYWRRGAVTMTAIAAIDTALWDIKAKAANMPLYQLLGGKSRDGVMVYGHANGGRHCGNAGRGRKISGSGLQGRARPDRYSGAVLHLRRVPRQDVLRARRREPADRKRLVDSEVYQPHPQAVRRRSASKYGMDFHLLHDAHHRLTPQEAAKVGKSRWRSSTCSGWRTRSRPRIRKRSA